MHQRIPEPLLQIMTLEGAVSPWAVCEWKKQVLCCRYHQSGTGRPVHLGLGCYSLADLHIHEVGLSGTVPFPDFTQTNFLAVLKGSSPSHQFLVSFQLHLLPTLIGVYSMHLTPWHDFLGLLQLWENWLKVVLSMPSTEHLSHLPFERCHLFGLTLGLSLASGPSVLLPQCRRSADVLEKSHPFP